MQDLYHQPYWCEPTVVGHPQFEVGSSAAEVQSSDVKFRGLGFRGLGV